MSRYAKGKHAKGICGRGGHEVPYNKLVEDGYIDGLMVDPAWRETEHPQERLPPASDPIALYRPAPETDQVVPTLILPPDDLFEGRTPMFREDAGEGEASSFLTASTWTLEARVRLDLVSTGERVPVLAKKATGGVSDAQAHFILWAQAGDLGTNNALALTVGDGASSETVVSSKTLDHPGIWYHIAVVVDAGTATFHVNPETADINPTAPGGDEKTLTITPTDSGQPVILGAYYDAAGDRATQGRVSIHDIRVWTKARTRAEMASDKAQRLDGDETSLEAYWKADEGGGTTLADATSNSHDITLTDIRWRDIA